MLFFFVLVIITITCAITLLMPNLMLSKKRKRPALKYPTREISHKFHEPVGHYEDNHADRVGRKLIKHEDPEEGYVVLNGVKHKIEDCKYL